MTIRQSIVSGLIKRFPDAPSKTLARIALRDNPKVFMNVEDARTSFRRARGASGRVLRTLPCVIAPRPCRMAGNPFGAIPEGKSHFDTWGALQIDGPVRALVISDVHIPYHERKPLLSALAWGKSNAVNTVILNGDFGDFFSVSRWEKDPRKRDLAGEIKTQRECLKSIREGFQKARIIFKEGNHEERWVSYLQCKAPEVLGMAEFDLPNVLKLGDFGIEHIGEKRPVRLGDLNVIHGHEYKFAISNPVNAARGLYLRAKAYALCGHFHQSSQHTEKNIEDRKIATWSTGCLCDMHPDYAPLNNWSHGFAVVEVDRDGKFQVHNKIISNGKVY